MYDFVVVSAALLLFVQFRCCKGTIVATPSDTDISAYSLCNDGTNSVCNGGCIDNGGTGGCGGVYSGLTCCNELTSGMSSSSRCSGTYYCGFPRYCVGSLTLSEEGMCDQCAAGYHGDASASCAECPAGTFKAVAGNGAESDVCVDCALGTYSTAGSTSCDACAAGYSGSWETHPALLTLIDASKTTSTSPTDLKGTDLVWTKQNTVTHVAAAADIGAYWDMSAGYFETDTRRVVGASYTLFYYWRPKLGEYRDLHQGGTHEDEWCRVDDATLGFRSDYRGGDGL